MKVEYKIYQIKDLSTPYSFIGWNDSVAAKFSIDDYELVYSGEIEKKHCLEKLFEIFNINHPADFRGHSLSVSDVVAIHDPSKTYWYWFYCDSFGWEEVTHLVGTEHDIA